MRPKEVFWWGFLMGFIACVLAGSLLDRAAAQPLSPEPVELDARVVALDAEIAVYMASRGYGAPGSPVLVGTEEWFTTAFSGLADGAVALAAATPQGTVLRRRVLAWINSPRTFGDLVHVLVHERGHRRQATTPLAADWTPLDYQVEEAAVEAMARDVTAGFLRHRYRWVSPPRLDAYPEGTAMVRACSARAGRGGWRSARAVRWRKAFWKATAQVRLERLRRCGVRV